MTECLSGIFRNDISSTADEREQDCTRPRFLLNHYSTCSPISSCIRERMRQDRQMNGGRKEGNTTDTRRVTDKISCTTAVKIIAAAASALCPIIRRWLSYCVHPTSCFIRDRRWAKVTTHFTTTTLFPFIYREWNQLLKETVISKNDFSSRCR